MRRQKGFVFVELIVVLGIIAVMFGLGTVSISRLLQRPPVVASVDVLIGDLRSQQGRAMAEEATAGTSTDFGVYLGSSEYVLFRGTSYVSSSPTNVPIALPSYVALSTTFANAQIVFSRGSGDIVGFVPSQNTITVRRTDSAEEQTIALNRYGAVVVQQ